MPTPITMPQLGESVTEGTVARWLKREGEHVERDEPLLEITTDKVNADLPSPVAGVLVNCLVAEGAVVAVGAPLAEIDEGTTGTPRTQAPVAAQPVTSAPGVSPAMSAAAPDGQGAEGPTHQDNGHGERRRYSPVVRKLAAEHGINLDDLVGTGLGGRVTKSDVEAFLARAAGAQQAGEATAIHAGKVTRDDVLSYMAARAPTAPPAAEPWPPAASETDAGHLQAPANAFAPPPAPVAPVASAPAPPQYTGQPGADEDYVPLTPMRRGIAEHMVRSKQTAPHATTVTEVDMTRLVRWRTAHKEAFRAREGVEITYVAFMIQAVVDALKAFPMLNAAWGGDKIILKKQINIGIAVGMDDGLIVPVIQGADERSLVGLARAVADLATRARAGKLTVQELQGGTFTVNNTGVFGSIVSTPVINQPQAAILSMEAIVKRPVVVDDAIAIRSMMNICLSFDHRIVDGLMAGRFSQRVKQNLEQPALPG